MGPIRDFDFDAAILFSDLLFPLEALGMSLSYDDGPPKLDGPLDEERIARFRPLDERPAAIALSSRSDRADAPPVAGGQGPDRICRRPVDAVCVCHGRLARGRDASGQVVVAALSPVRRAHFAAHACANIAQQLEAGADVVMVLDTAAGELPPAYFDRDVAPGPRRTCAGCFRDASAITQRPRIPRCYTPAMAAAPWGGIGVDSRWDLAAVLAQPGRTGFVQGNFDPAWLFLPHDDLVAAIAQFLAPIRALDAESTPRLDLRARSRCPAGHARSGRPHFRHFGQGSIRMTTLSLTQLLEKYDVPVPRYTSYPAVPNWQETPAASVVVRRAQRRARRPTRRRWRSTFTCRSARRSARFAAATR